eukprot:CCRYP_015719-RA/>CCRYP_015719-RA protein AED:0.37 eAED:0.54 QI:0/0/0/1/1/1/3/0/445
MKLQSFAASLLAFTFVEVSSSSGNSGRRMQRMISSSLRNGSLLTSRFHPLSRNPTFFANQSSNKSERSRRIIATFTGPSLILSPRCHAFRHSFSVVAYSAAPGKRRHSCSNIINSSEGVPNVKHWFTLTLPEGSCVGVTTSSEHEFLERNQPTTALSLSSLLHQEEFAWGQENISSVMSRTSFYLGRMALRCSLREILHLSADDKETMDEDSRGNSESFWMQIQSNPIKKDNYGRPILPNVVAGSISHKGEYAVGLSRFRFDDASLLTINNEEINLFNDEDSMVVNWKEECPVNPNEEDEDETILNDGSNSNQNSSVEGVGIDLERIDDERGERIRRKVLTEREQEELGGLETLGISRGEEVMLRFSLKESVYKAMHPVLCEYVGFQEAEVHPLADGTALVRLNFLKDRDSLSPRTRSMVVRSASWRRVNGFFLTSASVGVLSKA